MTGNSPARAGAEEEMRMGTEDELRDAVARALCEEVGRECADPACHCTSFIPDADAALWGLGIPLPVLAWITANPEAAKGLASGEMVAVPKPIGAELLRELLENPESAE
jgi:hypothetical protein